MTRQFFPTRTWSELEDLYVIKHAHRITPERLGILLGRSVSAIKTRQRLLGVPLRKFKGCCLNVACSAPTERVDSYCSEECELDVVNDTYPHRKEIIDLEYSASDLVKRYKISYGVAQNWIDNAGGNLSDKLNLMRSLYYPDLSEDEVKDIVTIDAKTISKRQGNHSKGGYREDIKVFVRSTWEANCIRYFNLKNIEWQYEPRVFPFPLKKGTISYTPDFWLPRQKKWIEVKGKLDSQSRIKLNRFKQYWPGEFKKMAVVVKNPNTDAAKYCRTLGLPVLVYYDDLSKAYSSVITNWEK
jgi:hypothetical protein